MKPAAQVLFGQGWDERGWPDPTPPTRAELDRAGGGAAVYLARVDVHSAVVSTALLERLPEVSAAPGYRDDGLVSREAHHLCRGALDRFFTDAERREAARVALRRCAELGVGTIHDLGGPHLGPVEDLARVRQAADETRSRRWSATGANWPRRAQHRPGPQRTRCGAWRATCASTGRSAPAPPPCARTTPIIRPAGVRYLSDDEIRDHVVACTQAGLQAGFHCIGDDAVSAAVQGLRRAADVVGAAALRSAGHRLEHVEMLDPSDIASLADLSVTASVQPAFDAAWGTSGELYEQRLGRQRSRSDESLRIPAARRGAAWPSAPMPRSRRWPAGRWSTPRSATRGSKSR